MSKEESSKLEWRVNVGCGATERLEPKSGLIKRFLLFIAGVILEGFIMKIWRFLEKAWRLGVAEPKRVIHGLKVGVALSVVSLFYYMRPLYEGVGGNAMWAVMTVVVVFESTVGATFSKCINRVAGTLLAGLLGVGVHWIATKSGEDLEPLVTGFSVFVFASAATFSRFVPSVKARYDYGSMIFILTFSLVTVSGYRVDKLLSLAQQRLSTIAIGTLICILVSTLFCPIWAGDELHRLIHRNLEKLAESLDGCVTDYFKDDEAFVMRKEEEEACMEKMQGYKCVLNSKATEESMANFARWEPPHGRFNFGHPWKLYLKMGASMRRCAYCVETLRSCIDSEIQAPPNVKKHFREACMRLSSVSSEILRELANTMKKMTESSKVNFLLGEMSSAVEELQNTIRSIPNQTITTLLSTTEVTETNSAEHETKIFLPPLQDILSLGMLASLLIENAARIQGTISAFNELASCVDFKLPCNDKPQNQSFKIHSSDNQDHGNPTSI